MSHLIEIFSAPKEFKGSVRPKVQMLELLVEHGIVNDKFAGKNFDRSVMIVGQIAYDIAKENGITLELGSLGENILFDFDPHELEFGSKIQVGDAILQITEKCSICSHLAVFDKRLPKLVSEHRGVYCKIIKNGRVSTNSTVTLL